MKNVTFVVMLMDEAVDRFVLIRMVDGLSTHYMGPDGMWQTWPETDDELGELFSQWNEDPTLLPQFDLEAAEEFNEGLEGTDDNDS
jgi:hypothetical protein